MFWTHKSSLIFYYMFFTASITHLYDSGEGWVSVLGSLNWVYFSPLRVYYSFRVSCILIWKLFALLFLAEKYKQIKNQSNSMNQLWSKSHKQKHITSVPIMRRNNSLHVHGPGGRQHYYVHHFNYVLLCLSSMLCHTNCSGNKCLIVDYL